MTILKINFACLPVLGFQSFSCHSKEKIQFNLLIKYESFSLMDTIKNQGSKMKRGKTGAKWLFCTKKREGGRPGGRKMRGGLVKTWETIVMILRNLVHGSCPLRALQDHELSPNFALYSVNDCAVKMTASSF